MVEIENKKEIIKTPENPGTLLIFKAFFNLEREIKKREHKESMVRILDDRTEENNGSQFSHLEWSWLGIKKWDWSGLDSEYKYQWLPTCFEYCGLYSGEEKIGSLQALWVAEKKKGTPPEYFLFGLKRKFGKFPSLESRVFVLRFNLLDEEHKDEYRNYGAQIYRLDKIETASAEEKVLKKIIKWRKDPYNTNFFRKMPGENFEPLANGKVDYWPLPDDALITAEYLWDELKEGQTKTLPIRFEPEFRWNKKGDKRYAPIKAETERDSIHLEHAYNPPLGDRIPNFLENF